jgi:UDP-2,3-diacylglucosamine pyrophosphatase LpxH
MGTLVMNGDTAEVHHPRHWSTACRQTLELYDACEADGVELVLLSGNHDPYITGHRFLALAGGQIFVTHGDAFHPAIAPWSPAAARMRKAHESALREIEHLGRADLEACLDAARRASHVEWTEMRHEAGRSSMRKMLVRPWLIVRVLHYWRRFPRLAATFAEEHMPLARFVVLGHTHHADIETVNGRTVINTGSYGFPGRPRGVIVDDTVLRVHAVDLQAGRHRLASDPLETYALEPATPPAPEPGAGALRPSTA